MESNKSINMLAFQALKRAARKAREKARRNNMKIPVWIDGEIHYMVPEPEEDCEEPSIVSGPEGAQFIYDEKFD
ncbi:MAG: hypothetical protein ACLFRG_08705 [Desulfococcaceae bacterium]